MKIKNQTLYNIYYIIYNVRKKLNQIFFFILDIATLLEFTDLGK